MVKKLFSAMSRRRISCPQTTHKLWDAIKIIRYQRQIPDVKRISRYMSRAHQTSEEDVTHHLGHCVRDNLVRLVKRVGFKGSQTGKKQESYRLPQGAVKKDNHDWYCFECHGVGDVICCTGCHRVYHLSCVAMDLSDEDVKKTFVCSVCKMCKESDKFKISRRELNHLLGFTCSRLKERRTFLTPMKKYEIIKKVDEKKITKTEIVRWHGIPKSTLFTILKMREEIVNAVQKEGHNVKAKNLNGATHANLEQAMLEWFSQHRKQNVRINGPMMQKKADEFALRLGIENFKCSINEEAAVLVFPIAASAKDSDDSPPVDANSQLGPSMEPQPGLSTAPLSAPLTFTRPCDEKSGRD
uniref:SAMD1-like winged helix (WH) domain-containing protein n=1 Tax=Timema tahoe TaxID=61484 RepID=A0A7R9FFK4_9NEOP|nr:unnamed protein product [Timema tahoe]